MLMTRVMKEISKISEEEEINTSNYMEAINYIGTLYNLLNKLKVLVPIKDVRFLPTFKGRLTCEKYGLPPAEDDEAEFRLIQMKSEYFLGDRIWEKIDEALGSMSSSIVYNRDLILIKLK